MSVNSSRALLFIYFIIQISFIHVWLLLQTLYFINFICVTFINFVYLHINLLFHCVLMSFSSLFACFVITIPLRTNRWLYHIFPSGRVQERKKVKTNPRKLLYVCLSINYIMSDNIIERKEFVISEAISGLKRPEAGNLQETIRRRLI